MDKGFAGLPESEQPHTVSDEYRETVVRPAQRLASMLDAMTDDTRARRERAQGIIKKILVAPKDSMAASVDIISDALADAERRGMERAATMAEEKADRSLKCKHLNIPEYNFGYRGGLRGLANEIRAQAGKEK